MISNAPVGNYSYASEICESVKWTNPGSLVLPKTDEMFSVFIKGLIAE